MQFKIGQLEFTITPTQFKIEGMVENTELKIDVVHRIFSGNAASVSVKIGELEVSAKL